jgi:hypothetical protein
VRSHTGSSLRLSQGAYGQSAQNQGDDSQPDKQFVFPHEKFTSREKVSISSGPEIFEESSVVGWVEDTSRQEEITASAARPAEMLRANPIGGSTAPNISRSII